MLQKMRVLLLVCITAVLAACGGGGGDETPNFAGNYLFAEAKLTSNNCNAAVPVALPGGGSNAVVQNGRAVSITSEGRVFTGSVDGDNGGFTVSLTQVISGTPVISTYSFRTITAGSQYQLTFTTAAGVCSAVYVGIVSKI